METRPRSTHLEGQLSVGQMKNDAAKATEPGTMSREPLSVHMRPTAQQTTVEGIFVRSLNNGRHQTAVQAAGCLRYRIRCLFQPVDKPVDQLCEVIGRDRSVWRPADCGRDGRVLLLAVGWLVARKLLTVAARHKCLQEIALPDDTLEVEVVIAKRKNRTAAVPIGHRADTTSRSTLATPHSSLLTAWTSREAAESIPVEGRRSRKRST